MVVVVAAHLMELTWKLNCLRNALRIVPVGGKCRVGVCCYYSVTSWTIPESRLAFQIWQLCLQGSEMKNCEARPQGRAQEFSSLPSSSLPTEMVYHFDVQLHHANIKASWTGAFS